MADVQSEVVYVNPDDTRTMSPGSRGNAHLTVVVVGPQGVPGLNGLPGEDGDDGWFVPGPQGLQGVQGSALVGPPGEDADDYGWPIPGTQGPQGVTGQSGPYGFQGEDADDYGWPIPGTQGYQGVPGPQGIQGQAGASGQPIVTNSLSLPPATAVQAGQMAFATDSLNPIATSSGTVLVGGGSFFVPVFSDGFNWILWAGGTQGPIGLTGATGAAGANGTNGTNGTNGSGGFEAAYTIPPNAASWAHTTTNSGDTVFGGGASGTSTIGISMRRAKNDNVAALLNNITNSGAGTANGWRATARLCFHYPVRGGFGVGGIFISDGTKYFCDGLGANGTSGGFEHRDWTNATTSNANSLLLDQGASSGDDFPYHIWFRLWDDKTNRNWQYSADGFTFTTFKQEVRTATFTATWVGFGSTNQCGPTTGWDFGSGGFPVMTECFSWLYEDL